MNRGKLVVQTPSHKFVDKDTLVKYLKETRFKQSADKNVKWYVGRSYKRAEDAAESGEQEKYVRVGVVSTPKAKPGQDEAAVKEAKKSRKPSVSDMSTRNLSSAKKIWSKEENVSDKKATVFLRNVYAQDFDKDVITGIDPESNDAAIEIPVLLSGPLDKVVDALQKTELFGSAAQVQAIVNARAFTYKNVGTRLDDKGEEVVTALFNQELFATFTDLLPPVKEAKEVRIVDDQSFSLVTNIGAYLSAAVVLNSRGKIMGKVGSALSGSSVPLLPDALLKVTELDKKDKGKDLVAHIIDVSNIGGDGRKGSTAPPSVSVKRGPTKDTKFTVNIKITNEHTTDGSDPYIVVSSKKKEQIEVPIFDDTFWTSNLRGFESLLKELSFEDTNIDTAKVADLKKALADEIAKKQRAAKERDEKKAVPKEVELVAAPMKRRKQAKAKAEEEEELPEALGAAEVLEAAVPLLEVEEEEPLVD